MTAHCEGCSRERIVTRYLLDDGQVVNLCDPCHDVYFQPQLVRPEIVQAHRTFTKGLAPTNKET